MMLATSDLPGPERRLSTMAKSAFRRLAADAQIVAEIDEPVGDAVPGGHFHHAVDGVFLADAPDVQTHAGLGQAEGNGAERKTAFVLDAGEAFFLSGGDQDAVLEQCRGAFAHGRQAEDIHRNQTETAME